MRRQRHTGPKRVSLELENVIYSVLPYGKSYRSPQTPASKLSVEPGAIIQHPCIIDGSA